VQCITYSENAALATRPLPKLFGDYLFRTHIVSQTIGCVCLARYDFLLVLKRRERVERTSASHPWSNPATLGHAGRPVEAVNVVSSITRVDQLNAELV